MQQVIANNATINYYDIFNEPDWTWSGISINQLLELFKIAHDKIRSYEPDAKIIGLSLGQARQKFDLAVLDTFFGYANDNNLIINGVSWHELELSVPEDVSSHVAALKSLSSYKLLCQRQGFCPEIHINEYAGPEYHLVPGWEVGWLYYFEKNKIDKISKACWDDQQGPRKWSGCWAGFDGLLMDDNINPQPIYWVHYSHVDMNGKMLETNFSDPRTVALASKDDLKQTIKLLVGRYGHDSNPLSDVNINIINYPYVKSTVQEKIYRIPNQGKNPSVLNDPILVFDGIQKVTENKTIFIPISEFSDGDAYFIVIQ
jgi:hypothetical protein